MTIAENLLTLNATKQAIKMAIEGKGQDTTDVPFTEYPELIDSITSSSDEWVRPSDWLALPVVNLPEQKIVGLHAVFNHDSNFIAFRMQGNYTVDWGDGSPLENLASGVVADHNYNFSNTALNGTLTSRGYKQAIITITPQAGQNLTNVNFGVLHPLENLSYSSGFLDITISTPNVTSLVFRNNNIEHRLVEQVKINTINTITNLQNMFAGCASLQSISLFNTANVTTMQGMFFSCQMLKTVPFFNTVSVVNGEGMFSTCTSLQIVPLFNFTNLIVMQNMFAGCASLKSIPLFNIPNVTSMQNTFGACVGLIEIPLFNTVNVQNMNATFFNCLSLQILPLFNTSNVVNFTVMFQGCHSLSKATLSGTKENISYANCRLSATQLNDIYTNLATVVGKTITVTGNYGASASNISIATNKGWTVVQ